MRQKKVVTWKPQNNILGNQLESINPEKSLFLISVPYPTELNLPIPDCNIPRNHFPLQLSRSPLPHRINRKLSLFEYIKQELSAEVTLFVSDGNIDINVLQHDISNELAYLGFTIYNVSGQRILPVSNTTLEIIPNKYPYLQSIPLPPRELIDQAAAKAAKILFKAERNRDNVARFRERNPPPEPKITKQPIQEEKPYNPSIFSSIPEMPEVESDEAPK